MDIKGIGNDITNAYSQITNSEESENDFQKIFDQAIDNQDDEELKEACQEFEAYFVQRLFTEMRKTIPDGGLTESSSEGEIYEEMLDEEYSKTISQSSGIGIASTLYKQLSPKSDVLPAKE